jgi:hypothetical protein
MTAIMENNREVTQKSDRPTIWNRNLTTGYISKGYPKYTLSVYHHSQVHCTIIHNSQDVESHVYQWMNTLIKYGIYTQWNIIQPLKKDTMDEPNQEDIMLSELS